MATKALFCALLVSVVAVELAACSGRSEPKTFGFDEPSQDDSGVNPGSDSSILFDVGPIQPPDPDASGFCGNSFFKSLQRPPNLYFVLDRSGSMLESAAGASRYQAVCTASVNLVKKLGSRARIGAAVFPGEPEQDECGPGREVFPTVTGDVDISKDASISKAFAAAINVYPIGGTPIASTLEVIRPTLAALSGKTFVILATDGGPNCNKARPCMAKDCIWSIEGSVINSHKCSSSYNCCDPALVPNGPVYQGCLDALDTLAAVQLLRDSGVYTFVVGIPGSGPYESLLNQIAIVGGTARANASHRYYRVDDIAMLSATLNVIGEKALVTCDFTLDSAPPDLAQVNVYLDKEVVPFDESNGWAWTGPQALSLRGEACQKFESGLYKQVQVVAGCPTEKPR